jgi:hypothetical protein
MEVKLIQENEDGSADYEILGLSQVEQEFLIQKGLITALREMLEREAEEGRLPALLKEKLGGTD